MLVAAGSSTTSGFRLHLCTRSASFCLATCTNACRAPRYLQCQGSHQTARTPEAVEAEYCVVGFAGTRTFRWCRYRVRVNSPHQHDTDGTIVCAHCFVLYPSRGTSSRRIHGVHFSEALSREAIAHHGCAAKPRRAQPPYAISRPNG